jgi:hypothetical protein
MSVRLTSTVLGEMIEVWCRARDEMLSVYTLKRVYGGFAGMLAYLRPAFESTSLVHIED